MDVYYVYPEELAQLSDDGLRNLEEYFEAWLNTYGGPPYFMNVDVTEDTLDLVRQELANRRENGNLKKESTNG